MSKWLYRPVGVLALFAIIFTVFALVLIGVFIGVVL